MICKRLYNTILQNCKEMELAMYRYGIDCAKLKTLDFFAIAKTFEKLKFNTEDKDANTKIIMKGFCRGLNSAVR